MTRDEAIQATQESHPELSRDLGFYAVFTTATGTMVGAGIFILPGVAAEGAGPAAALSFLFAGLIATTGALCVSELASAMPRAGGPYYFVSRAMGPLMGTILGLGAWIALVVKGAFALVGFGEYIRDFVPVPVLSAAVVAGVLLTLINYVGAKASGQFQNLVVLGLIGVLGLFVARGLMSMEPELLTPALPFGWGGVFSTTGVVFISYLGVLKAAAVAEEVRDPGRDIPWGITSSVVVVTLLYVAVMLVTTGVLPIAEIVGMEAPLAEVARIFLGTVGGVLVAVAGLLATASTGNAAVLSSSRYAFAMSRDGLMMRWLNEVHRRFGTPFRAIVVTGGVMILLALVMDVEGLARLGGMFGILGFVMANVTVLVLRGTRPEWYQPTFRVPAFPWVQIAGIVTCLALIPAMGLASALVFAAFVVLAILWYYWRDRVMAAEGRPVEPDHGVRDLLERIRHSKSIEEKKRALGKGPPETRPATVLAELAEGKPNKHLLALASAVARRHGAGVDALVVTEVPYQSPLGSDLPSPPEAWLEKVRARQEAFGVPLRLHLVRARDRARAILSYAGVSTRAILLDWHDVFHPLRIRGSYVDRVLRDSPVRVGVLKYRGHEEYERILVATAGSPYALAEVEMADALAEMTNASLTLMLVLPASASRTRVEQARDYLQGLDEITRARTELRVLQGNDVVQEILDAGRDHDLIVLGASRDLPLWDRFRGHLVGPVADEIAERSEGSVLVTKDPAATRVIRSRLRRWLQRLQVGSAGPPTGEPAESDQEAPSGRRIRPFPRPDR